MPEARFTFQEGLVSGASQTPFQRTIEPATLGLFLHLEQRDMQRLRRIEEHWRFYLGQHWSFTREDGEPLVTINLMKMTVDKGVSWLVGQGFTMQVPDTLADYMLPPIKDVWDINEEQVLLTEIAQMGGVTGDAWVLVTREQLGEGTFRAAFPNVKGNSIVRLQLLGSEAVFPIWDPLNVSKLVGVKIVTLFADDSDLGNPVPRQDGQQNIKRFTQVITASTIVEQLEGEEARRFDNPLGEIPVVHIRNLVAAREFWGMSDMDGGLVDLQRELNEKATDLSDIINYHAHPITVIVGAKAKNLERSAKRVWSGFPAGTQVFNLAFQGDLKLIRDYIEMIQAYILGLMELPDSSMGTSQPISNTSGVALQTRFQTTVERVRRKKPQYERGLSLINYFIIRWLEIIDGFEVPQNFCKHCGGKVVDLALRDRQGRVRRDRFGRAKTKPKCFHADPWTNDFVEPDDMKIRFVRQFSFGNEIGEAERWRVVAMALKQRRSFWDPLAALKQEESPPNLGTAVRRDEEDRDEVSSGSANPAEPREEEEMFKLANIKLPEGSIQVPEEPERVTIFVERFNEVTGQPVLNGEGQPIVEQEELMLVPTGCRRPELFNPYNIPVTLNDALPRDEHLEAQLAVQLTGAGLWSRRHAMRRLKIENVEKMLEELEQDAAFMEKSGSWGGVGDDLPPAGTEMQDNAEERSAQRPEGPNQPANGGPVRPSPGRPQNPDQGGDDGG